MPPRKLAPIRGKRNYACVALSPDSIRLDMYETDGTERAVGEYNVAEAMQLITDLQHAVADAMRMES